MNLQSTVLVNFVSIALLVILFISSHLVRQRHSMSDKLFTFMIGMTASASFVEAVTYIIDGTDFPGNKIAMYIGNSYLYIANLAVSVAWLHYVDLRLYNDENRVKKYVKQKSIPAYLGVAGVIANFFVPFIFTIDSENYYHRTAFGFAYYGIILLYLISSYILRQHYFKTYEPIKFFPLSMFIIPVIIGTTVQAFFYGYSVGWCSVSLGLVGIYMSMQNELSYIDPLTKLYNRNYLEHVIEVLRRSGKYAGGIMIDMDYFKSINDKYGHSIGDQAIVDAANTIREHSPQNAICIRFAGDEFVVILDTEDENAVAELAMGMREAVREFNAAKVRPYDLSFSIGCCMLDEDCSADAFLSGMDKAMYVEKHEKHARDGRDVR